MLAKGSDKIGIAEVRASSRTSAWRSGVEVGNLDLGVEARAWLCPLCPAGVRTVLDRGRQDG